MLGENTNPNINHQVPEVQCPPAGQPLDQQKRPREANGQFTFTSAEAKKRSRTAAQANFFQKNARTTINKALESNIFEALGELATREGKNGKARIKMSTTEVLVFLLSHTRLNDGTCFEVDPANEYEITMVRDSRAFFCMFALNFFDFSDKRQET